MNLSLSMLSHLARDHNYHTASAMTVSGKKKRREIERWSLCSFSLSPKKKFFFFCTTSIFVTTTHPPPLSYTARFFSFFFGGV